MSTNYRIHHLSLTAFYSFYGAAIGFTVASGELFLMCVCLQLFERVRASGPGAEGGISVRFIVKNTESRRTDTGRELTAL